MRKRPPGRQAGMLRPQPGSREGAMQHPPAEMVMAQQPMQVQQQPTGAGRRTFNVLNSSVGRAAKRERGDAFQPAAARKTHNSLAGLFDKDFKTTCDILKKNPLHLAYVMKYLQQQGAKYGEEAEIEEREEKRVRLVARHTTTGVSSGSGGWDDGGPLGDAGAAPVGRELAAGRT